MSLINVQASVALHLRGTHPEQVDEALRVIKGASKEALVELRSLIEVLREGDGAGPAAPGREPRGPRRPRRAHPATPASTSPRTSPARPSRCRPGSSCAAYRVVQEAVTNVVRHSGADRAEVVVEHRPGRLVVTRRRRRPRRR